MTSAKGPTLTELTGERLDDYPDGFASGDDEKTRSIVRVAAYREWADILKPYGLLLAEDGTTTYDDELGYRDLPGCDDFDSLLDDVDYAIRCALDGARAMTIAREPAAATCHACGYNNAHDPDHLAPTGNIDEGNIAAVIVERDRLRAAAEYLNEARSAMLSRSYQLDRIAARAGKP